MGQTTVKKLNTKASSHNDGHFIRGLRESALFVFSAIALYLCASLITYNSADPGWSHSDSGNIIANAGGVAGAWFADFFLYLFGYLAYLFPVMVGYCGWLTLQAFFGGRYLSGDFFMHAFWAIGLILFLSFFILQLCIRAAASSGRITGKAFEKLKGQLDHLNSLNQNPLKSQLETVLGLAALAEADGK